MAVEIIHIIGLALVALVLGGMIFFACIMTPLVFTKLPPEISGPFIREAFPVYSLAMAVLTLLAGAFLVGTQNSLILFVVFALFIFGWKVLMPIINKYRDAQLAGDSSSTKPFNRLHRASVILNTAQMIMVAVVFIRLVI
jgi:Domain of unknown function (DUF4149)